MPVMFYVLRVNIALVTLGIAPNSITAEFRQGPQLAGRQAATRLRRRPSGSPPNCLLKCMRINPAPIKGWIRSRKVDHRLEAKLSSIGYLELNCCRLGPRSPTPIAIEGKRKNEGVVRR